VGVLLASLHSAPALGPVAQDHLLQARQMQALSFTAHIPLVCFGIASPPPGSKDDDRPSRSLDEADRPLIG
jgi:hypothetical protein